MEIFAFVMAMAGIFMFVGAGVAIQQNSPPGFFAAAILGAICLGLTVFLVSQATSINLAADTCAHNVMQIDGWTTMSTTELSDAASANVPAALDNSLKAAAADQCFEQVQEAARGR